MTSYPEINVTAILTHHEIAADIDWYTATGVNTWSRYTSLVAELELDLTYDDYLNENTEHTDQHYSDYLEYVQGRRSYANGLVNSGVSDVNLSACDVVYKYLSTVLDNRNKAVRYFEEMGMEFPREQTDTELLALVFNHLLLEYKEYLWYRANDDLENNSGSIYEGDDGELYLYLGS